MENKTDKSVSVSNSGTPISVDVDPVALVNGILDCYKNVKINQEIQETERARIREQSRVYIAAIEANTKKFEMTIKQTGTERMAFITTICNLLSRDILDDNSVKLCELVLNYLNENNPLAAIKDNNPRLLE